MKVAIITIAILAVVFGGIGYIVYLDIQRAKRRLAAFRAAAEELGFDFLPEGDGTLLPRLQLTALGSQGNVRKLTNLLRGKAQGLDVAIFDYEWRLHQGESDPSRPIPCAIQTVVLIQSQELDLPPFLLKPQRIWHSIGSAMGMQDLNFETHPKFSRSFVLRAVDETAVRRLFEKPTLDFFENAGPVTVEGFEDVLLLYSEGQKRDDVSAALKQGFDILTVLRQANANHKSHGQQG